MWRYLALLLVVAATSSAKQLNRNATAGKGRFAVFNVVKFPNEACEGTNNINGTCYTDAECTDRDGTSSGSCADGYGVCCTFTLGCGDKSAENCTYFQSEGKESGHCRADVCSVNSNICQLRLDFQTFVVNQPSTSTVSVAKLLNGVPAAIGNIVATATQCDTDTFNVVSSGGGNVPAAICGTNTNEHMYVDISRGGCAALVFTLGTAAVTRNWNIKVSQYECGYENRAPQGCTKYYFGTGEGSIKTYNFDAGLHLANQKDTMCIRRERGQCRICYATTLATDFMTSGIGAMDIKVGKTSMCCGYKSDGMEKSFDCAVIPGASKKTDGVMITGNEFCGGGNAALIGGLVTASGAVPKTVCTKTLPFTVKFLSDNYESTVGLAEAAGSNAGFKLSFKQYTC